MTGLERLLGEIAHCRICVETPRGKPLAHEPRPVLQVSPTARLLIASQAPGTRVHASGRPFTDPSGDRLRAWTGLSQDVFYDASRVAIMPMGMCFPGQDEKGGDLPPRRECAPAWRHRVMQHLPDIRLVLAVGRPAQAWHLGDRAKANLTETVADWRLHLEANPPVIPLPHPSWRNNAWIARHPWFEAELVPVLRKKVAKALALSRS